MSVFGTFIVDRQSLLYGNPRKTNLSPWRECCICGSALVWAAEVVPAGDADALFTHVRLCGCKTVWGRAEGHKSGIAVPPRAVRTDFARRGQRPFLLFMWPEEMITACSSQGLVRRCHSGNIVIFYFRNIPFQIEIARTAWGIQKCCRTEKITGSSFSIRTPVKKQVVLLYFCAD